MKQTVTATLPDGSTVRRTTSRNYTHVVVGHDGDGEWGVFQWCSRYDLACKAHAQVASWHRLRCPDGTITIIPTDIIDNA